MISPVDAICRDLRNAYEGHDSDAFDRHIARLRRMLAYTGPIPAAAAVVDSSSDAAPAGEKLSPAVDGEVSHG